MGLCAGHVVRWRAPILDADWPISLPGRDVPRSHAQHPVWKVGATFQPAHSNLLRTDSVTFNMSGGILPVQYGALVLRHGELATGRVCSYCASHGLALFRC